MSSASFCLLPLTDTRYAVRVQAGPWHEAAVLPLAFESFLYLRPGQLNRQPHDGERLSFYLEDHAAGLTVAQFHVSRAADTAHSPWQAPFGSVQLAAGMRADVLLEFLRLTEAQLLARGLRHIHIRSYPFAYDPAGSALLTDALRQSGYQVTRAELNNHLPLAADFAARLHPSERRRLHKCRRHGLHFEQEPPYLLPLAYEFLARCRQEKGQQLSLELARLQELFRQFPREYFLFSVRDAAGEWAALTVAIQVNSEVLYNFYPASPLAYNAFSPVVMLNEGLHAFGRASGLRLLDLGTSTLPTGLNQSLLQFKRHLGGVPSLKLTFDK
ncbi:hypothetical protein [Hymenobacter fastidiosus]|uniref:hypothetical protein n=1 Tax=Hymenobacter fastidiosus TaxID=486264 RepID=UPI0031F1A7DA